MAGAAIGAAAWAASDDRAAATAIVAEMDRDTAHKSVTAEAVAHARAALRRGDELRAAHDDAHARLADALAREWAETARDAVRAVDAERAAAALRVAATDAGARAERERALLEEGIAQNGRLRAQLEAIEREATKEPEKTSKQGALIDAGARTAPRPANDGGATRGAPRGAARGTNDGGAP